jgi:uncharacterized protein YciI
MSPQYDWLVQIPDNTGVLSTRLSFVQAHLSYNKAKIESGIIVMSGPTLSTHQKNDDGSLPITGSVMMYRAADEDEVLRSLRADPYASNGVWDLKSATITPYFCAVRKPLL